MEQDDVNIFIRAQELADELASQDASDRKRGVAHLIAAIMRLERFVDEMQTVRKMNADHDLPAAFMLLKKVEKAIYGDPDAKEIASQQGLLGLRKLICWTLYAVLLGGASLGGLVTWSLHTIEATQRISNGGSK